MNNQNHRWRTDIDGLRGIAIISVILFHLSVTNGGFVGVDIFFVISGYLISQIIFKETAARTFSLVKFYERRARRILPALLVVSAITSYAAYRLFFPDELIDFGRSLVAALFFSSNIYFFSTSDYFSPAALQIPLLHYWSLGVEEQFYLVFPILVIAIRKISESLLKPFVIVCLLASLTASAFLTHSHPTMTFYLLPFRAFELLIGSFIALPQIALPGEQKIALVASCGGLVMIALSIFLFNHRMIFPGYKPLLPCVGSALILWGGSRPTAVSQLLGAPPLRAVGRISYSLYLIHWPVIVFVTRCLPDWSAASRTILCLFVTFVGAVLSFYLVEQPVRLNRTFWTQKMVFGSALVVICAMVFAGIAPLRNNGFPKRFAPHTDYLVSFLHYDTAAPYQAGTCFPELDQHFKDVPLHDCLGAGRGRAVLWGDSTAAMMYFGLAPYFKSAGYTLKQISAARCQSIVGVDVAVAPNCRDFNRKVLATLLNDKPDLLILSSFWEFDPQDMIFLKGTLNTLRAAGIKTVIIGPKPFYAVAVPMLLANRSVMGNSNVLISGAISSDLKQRDGLMAAMAQQYGMTYISVLNLMCPGDVCPLETNNGVPIEFDKLHFTADGSSFVAKMIAPSILPLMSGGGKEGARTIAGVQ